MVTIRGCLWMTTGLVVAALAFPYAVALLS